MRLIDKDKVIAEMNRSINAELEIIKKYTHPFYATEITRCNARIALLEQFRDFINTLEMKEIKPAEQENEDEMIRKLCKELIESSFINELCNKEERDACINWIEKQGKQELPQVYETVDGEIITYSESEGYKVVEPKFKIGDWICNDGNSYLIADIDLDKRRYLFEVGGYTNTFLNWESIENADKNYHLWTIKDAKEGDILVYGDKENHHVTIYMIFKSRRDEITAYTYFHMFNYEFKFNNWCDCGQSAHPATLQQRNMLFKRIMETGFEWNSAKKELKTIEKSKWSEEDEHRLKDTIYFLNTAKKHYASTVELDACINWINSLKQKMEE